MHLHFHPWIVKRTILHEYFSRSWALFDAAERTEHSGAAAMLTGQSFELAIKAMLILAGRKPPMTHKIADCLDQVPQLKPLLKSLWDNEFEFMIQFLDEDINSSQMRYGAAGSRIDKRSRLIAASIAHKSVIWTASVKELYEELMCSVGAAIWDNYPSEYRGGQRVRKHFNMYPVFESGSGSIEVYPHCHKSLYGFNLVAEHNGIETDFGATIPIEGIAQEGTYWVRVRICKESAVDQQVVQKRGHFSLTNIFRWIGQPVDGVKLKLYEVRSTLQDVRPPVQPRCCQKADTADRP